MGSRTSLNRACTRFPVPPHPDSSRSKAVDAPKPAFQPRKVKKQTEGKYRDRASERREGKASDYAQAEALLQDFKKRTANEDKDVVRASPIARPLNLITPL